MDMNNVSGVRSDDGSWRNSTRYAHVLLVDQNPASLVYTASLLQEHLYIVTIAASAATALKFFEARKGFYDIVIADFHMQDMNIYDFMQRILDQCLTGMPIILMAEDYPVDVIKEALEKGASFFYQKPLVPDNIAFLQYHLWPQILHFPDRVHGATTFSKQKKKVLVNSSDGDGKRRKIRNAQDGVTIKEAGLGKTSKVRTEHRYSQAPSYLEKPNNGRQPCNYPNYAGYTFDGVQQIINRLKSNNALNGTPENVIMNSGSDQVAGENGYQLFMEGQVTPTDDYLTHAFQIPNQEASGNLSGGMYLNENVNMNTIMDQVAGENGGIQLFMEGGHQVTPTNGHVTGAFQIPNQEALGDFCRGLYGNENVIMNTGSRPVAGEIGAQVFMEGHHLTSTNGGSNGYVTGALQLPNEEASGGLVRGIYCNENTGDLGYMNTGQGTDTSHSDTVEAQLTADDISELLSYVNGEEGNLAVEEKWANHQRA